MNWVNKKVDSGLDQRQGYLRQDTGDDVGPMRQVSSRGEDGGRQEAAAITWRIKTTITAAK